MIKRLREDFEIRTVDDVMIIQNIKNKKAFEIIEPYRAIIIKLFDGVRTVEDIKEIISYLSEGKLNWQRIYSTTIKMYGHLLEEVKCDDAKREVEKIEPFSIKEILDFSKERKLKCDILQRRMAPTKIMWMISEQCVRRCKYCYLGNKTKSFSELENNIIPKEKVETLAKECYQLGVKEIVFSGGDPMTCKNIYYICNLFLNQGLKVVILTKMKIDYLQLINMNYKKISFMFSLDSIIEKTADELAGYVGHCKEMKENFLMCEKLNIPYLISITVCKNNLSEIIETVKTLIEEFKGTVMITRYSSFGESNNSFQISNKDYIDLCEELACYVKENKCETRLQINSQDAKNNDIKPCDAGREKMVINSSGNAIICEKIFSQEIAGNVFEDGILSVWNSDRYKGLFGMNTNSISENLGENIKWECPIKCNP